MDPKHRVRFPPSASFSIFLVLSAVLAACAVAVSVEPVLTVPGEYNIVLFLDIYETSPTANSTCTESNPAVFPVLLSAVNLIQWLEAETNISMGLAVYDTCGPVQRLLRQINRILADDSLTPRAIITMTSPETASAVADVLRHTNVQHVDVTSDPLEDNVIIRDNHYTISNTPRARVETTIRLLGILRINYFRVSVTDNHVARTEAALFRSLVQQSETLCEATFPAPSGSDYPLLLFTGNAHGDSEANEIKTGFQRSAKVVVVVGDHASVVSNDVRQTIVWLQNVLDVTPEELIDIFQNPPISTLLHLRQPLCSSYHLAGDVTASDACSLTAQTLRDVLAVRDALSILSVHALRHNDSSDTPLDLLHSMDAAAPLFEDELMSRTVRDTMYRVRISGPGAPRETDNSTYLFNFPEATLRVPNVLLQADVSSSCEVNCHLCDTCSPKATSDEKMMVSVPLESASLVVVGIFPVHTSQPGVLHDCSTPNPEGYLAARGLLSAIEMFNNKTSSSSSSSSSSNLHSLKIGGVVFDSCEHRHRVSTIVRDLETCFLSYKDLSGNEVIISPSKVIAYVAFASPSLPLGVDKLFLAVNESGFGFRGDQRIKFVTLAAKVLLKLDWTYLTVVVPDDKKALNEILETFALHDLCIARIIDSKSFVDNTSHASELTKRRPIVFLTDAESTESILDRVISRSGRSKLTYIFLPWNVQVAYGRSARVSMEVAILITPRPRRTSSTPPVLHDERVEDPWEEEFVSQNNSTVEQLDPGTQSASSVSQAVGSLLSALDSVYKNTCPEQDGVCKAFTDLSTVKTKVYKKQQKDSVMLQVLALRPADEDSWTETQIGNVLPNDTVLLLEDVRTLPVGNCPGWCPECFSCRSDSTTAKHTAVAASSKQQTGTSPTVVDIYKPGDLLIVGLFPVSKPGPTPFQCGEVANNLDELRAEQAFLFAVDTFQSRYPHALENVNVGGLLLDSCSSLPSALHTLGELNSCGLEFATTLDQTREAVPAPALTVGYILQDPYETALVVKSTIAGMRRMAVVSSAPSMNDGLARTESPFRMSVDAILSIFRLLRWSQAFVVMSEDENLVSMAEYFNEQAGSLGLCVVKCQQMKTRAKNLRSVVAGLSQSSAFVPAVLFLSRADAVTLFRNSEVSRVARPWVISLVGDDWHSTVGVNFPWGALLIDVLGKVNDDFHVFLENFSTTTTTTTTTTTQPLPSPWWQAYLQKRFHCQPEASSYKTATPQTLCGENPLHTAPMHPSPAASRVVRAVDSLLHAMDRRYKATCLGAQGFCRNMTSIVLEGGTRLAGVRFEYEGGIISFGDSDNMELSLVVMSYQPSELLLVGTYRSTGLSMNTSNVKFFTSGGLPLTLAQPNWQCRDCACVNVVTGNTTSGGATVVSDERFPFQSGLWWSQQGVMVMEVWSYAVLGISVAGALVTFVFILFVLFKVWQGALAKRYIGLGLLLLLAVILLYLSALPFVITPSPTVCGLRYVCPALAYGLCFAVILVKLMALQDYRRIGLGGELSGVNQGLSVFFIVLVQVSISLQWWWFHQPFLLQADGPREGRKRFACDFDRRSFILCLAFVIFLVLLCSVYSVTVRKEKKNAGEARLLLLCCWLTAAVWLTWVSMVMALEARWAPLLCSVGVLATASAVLLIVFVPKVRLVARLKYDLHKKHAGRSGYSVDTDFLYERPYSLPGTLTSTYSSIRTYPKSVTANFDSSLSY